ncbi:ABC transporter permease [Cohnella pontilimi]|uniref:ABC transporter permease n=1 Tax=Cohnella pontilimi TaxID=2564100 RepID=A0A4U0FFN4_9BACL|nr:ABC transporter permease [Cohnella pontilimi]TJY42172.1 ABC transporter permease [Cohnella pontilimi]
MALFVMIIRKMVQNKWLVSSLFFGMLMTVALVGTMPIYSEAILSRMLVKDLETSQTESAVYPGSHWSVINFFDQSEQKRRALLARLDGFMQTQAAPGFGIPVEELVTERRTKSVTFSFEESARNDPKRSKPSTSLRSFTDFAKHIKLTDGRMPSDKPVNGVYETLVTERALTNFKIVLDTVLVLEDPKIKGTVKIKPVGVFVKKEDDDPYFRDPLLSDLGNSFIVTDALFQSEFTAQGKIPVSSSGWFFVLDYTKMELRNVQSFLDTNKLIKNTLTASVGRYQADFKVPALHTIESYFARATKLRTLMWSLNVPVLIMLGFYMFMVSNLIVDRQRNEIAVLRSRGAARWQIVASFAVEGLLLSAAALALGPPIGLKLTEVLGASNGFLEFVQRARMPVHLNSDAYLYGALAAAASFLMTLIPALLATRVTIVGHKQQLARFNKTPLWHKAFLDVLTLGIAIYGLYTFRTKLKDIQKLGLNVDDLRIDPLQFVVPALFVVGAGLLLLRVYPYALRLVYWIGRKWWPPSLYATLIQVGRSNSQYQFLMVFLILTIAIGVFSAGAARTLNNNTEDRIRYANGADVVLESEWPNDKPPPAPAGPQGAIAAPAAPVPSVVHYLEPPFDPYMKLPGVEAAAKVFVKPEASFYVGEANGSATLIGIDSDDFGRTAWFPERLLPYPLYDYLNLIASDSRAVLISRTLAEQRKVKPGDTIYAGWGETDKQPFLVYGVIDYFPTFNPNPPLGSIDAADEQSKDNAPMLIVGHLSRMQLQLGLEPYQVWLKLKPGTTTEELYQGIAKSDLNVTRIVNTRADLVKAKNDPFLMALNGVLTLGFIISILISFVGFLLYWVLSLKGRTLQNGILRAVGLSLRQLVSMLALEQLLTSGVAILIGVFVGNLASRLYVPNFQIAFNPSSLVPPFQVVFKAIDFLRLYSTVGIMLLIGIGILSYMLSRIRVHQALKLGED